MLEEIDFIMGSTRTLTLEELVKDEVMKRAVLRSLEVIGEAAKNISADFRKQHPTIEWKSVAGLRDKLIHGYFGVKWEIVWDVVQNRLPALKSELEKMVSR